MGDQVDSRALQESTMSYIPVKPAAIEMAGKYIPVPHTQGINNTIASPILKSLAISYQENQPVDLDL